MRKGNARVSKQRRCKYYENDVPVMKALIQFVFKKDDYKQTDICKAGWIELVWSMYEDYLKNNDPDAYFVLVNEVEATATEITVTKIDLLLSDKEEG